MKEWKNYLKGLFDTKPSHLEILVTGSARLDTFRQSGDSLAGRYFRHRLNPLSLAEIPDADEHTLGRLLIRGGFPEPFLAEHDADAQRWRLQYVDGLVRTDILDFETIHDLKALQLTLSLLRRRVGSLVSYSSLARDVGVAPNTIKHYISIFEALFIVFRVTPYNRNIARSLLKDSKFYFYDTGMVVGEEGARFENLVAVSLKKHLDAIEDYQGRRTMLQYLRTKEKKEVDFALVMEEEVVQLIEAKLSDHTPSSALIYFSKKYGFRAIQLLKHCRIEQVTKGIEIRSALQYLKSLYA